MAGEYTDKDIPIECSECGEYQEGIPDMISHLLSKHPNSYTPEEAANFADIWADNAYEQIELENIERADYFRRHGEDPFEPESDKDYGD
jgi:hypothetical protein